MKQIFLVLTLILTLNFFGCGKDNPVLSNSPELLDNHNDPIADYNQIGVYLTDGIPLDDIRANNYFLPNGFTYMDSVVYDYRHLPTVGSKTTVYYQLASGELKTLVFPWNSGYMSQGIYGLYFEGNYTNDKHFVMVAGRNAMSGAYPDIYMFKDGNIQQIPYPDTIRPPSPVGLLPLNEVKIYQNIVAGYFAPGRFQYSRARQSYDVVTSKRKVVYAYFGEYYY